jgi:hypothetical protein
MIRISGVSRADHLEWVEVKGWPAEENGDTGRVGPVQIS